MGEYPIGLGVEDIKLVTSVNFRHFIKGLLKMKFPLQW